MKKEKRVAFIGAGKVGFSLGRFFVEGGIQVTGYLSRHQESAKQAALFTKSKVYDDLDELINDSNVIFLTVPDGEITKVFEQMIKYDITNKEICHCSGALTAEEAFPNVREKSAQGYSIHPLFPVSDKLLSYRELTDAFFCLEGDEEGLCFWYEWLNGHCGGVKMIQPACKVKYHAACAIASNLYCGLANLSVKLLSDCGFDERQALRALSPLMKSNLEHILTDGPIKALTGPVERGDFTTIEKHITQLTDERDRQMYEAVTRSLVTIAKQKNPDREYSVFEKLV